MTLFSKVALKQYKKNTKKILPFFFTFANAILGLLSIVKALDNEFIAAAYCILFAAFMDSIDGKIARALNSSTILGMELDSLCDAISFCLAPSILVYSWGPFDFGLFGFLIVSIFLCSGLFRLAKFNVISPNVSNSWFLGLPTPVAAFLLATLVLHEQWLEISLFNFIFKKYAFSIILLFISFLMISTIKFPSLKKNSGLITYAQILLCIFMFITLIFKSPYLIFVPILYMILGFSCYFFKIF